MNPAERMLPILKTGIAQKEMPLVVPHAFGERRDIAAATISEAYGQMLQEIRFGDVEKLFISPREK